MQLADNERKILELCTEDDLSLRATCKVFSLWPAVKAQVWDRFIGVLGQRVFNTFGEDWQAKLMKDAQPVRSMADIYSGLYIFRSAWQGQYAIGLSNQGRDGNKTILGIYNFNRITSQSFVDHELKSALDRRFQIQSSSSSNWWAWYFELASSPRHQRYANWDDFRTIERMGAQTADLANELIELFRPIDLAGGAISNAVEQERSAPCASDAHPH